MVSTKGERQVMSSLEVLDYTFHTLPMYCQVAVKVPAELVYCIVNVKSCPHCKVHERADKGTVWHWCEEGKLLSGSGRSRV